MDRWINYLMLWKGIILLATLCYGQVNNYVILWKGGLTTLCYGKVD